MSTKRKMRVVRPEGWPKGVRVFRQRYGDWEFEGFAGDVYPQRAPEEARAEAERRGWLEAAK